MVTHHPPVIQTEPEPAVDRSWYPQYQVKTRVDLGSLFLGLQQQLAARFHTTHDHVYHRPSMGAAAEQTWLALFRDYLPERYTASSAFVIDHRGELSQQIDIVVYDRQYSPLVFRQDSVLYVPAESVYAVFDVKQQLMWHTLSEASQKAASVRRLRRTSSSIRHAGGTYKPRDLFPILAGVLSLSSQWADGVGDSLARALRKLSRPGQLDLGCAVDCGAFEVLPHPRTLKIVAAPKDSALIFFLMRFLQRLQKMGTAPAIDLEKYSRTITARALDPGPIKSRTRP
jgi:hypothetical protein